MKEKVQSFVNEHALVYCVIMEIAGLGGMILAGFLIQLLLNIVAPTVDYYVVLFLQEAVGSIIMIGLIKLSGLEEVMHRRGIGFGRGLLVGMYFLVISIYTLVVSVLIYEGARVYRPWYLILIYVSGMMMVGVAEEFLFRGIIAEILLRHFGATRAGVWKAVVISGFLFGCAHLTNLMGGEPVGVLVQVAVASVMGMVFAAIYFRSGCIWVTVFLHGLVDVAGTIVTGIYVGDATVVDVISSYTPLQLIGMIPYLIVLLVLLRGSKMKELLRRMNGELPNQGKW